jgi:hypothetical protein
MTFNTKTKKKSESRNGSHFLAKRSHHWLQHLRVQAVNQHFHNLRKSTARHIALVTLRLRTSLDPARGMKQERHNDQRSNDH